MPKFNKQFDPFQELSNKQILTLEQFPTNKYPYALNDMIINGCKWKRKSWKRFDYVFIKCWNNNYYFTVVINGGEHSWLPNGDDMLSDDWRKVK